MTYTLKIYVKNTTDELMLHYYQLATRASGGAYAGDAGVDLMFPGPITIPSRNKLNGIAHRINLGIHTRMEDADGNPVSYVLLPRSSISKTPFRLANSIGLIDSGYRGELQVRVDNNLPDTNHQIDVEAGCYFQIVAPGYAPIRVDLVNTLQDLGATDRGDRGFGSSG